MRLWHKDLIDVLPTKQLVSQWRELSAIVGAIEKNGTPNHMLVNKVLEYPSSHLMLYSLLIKQEMEDRGFKPSLAVMKKINDYCVKNGGYKKVLEYDELFKDWHNDRYYKQCFYNLQEKFDCDGIDINEWKTITGKSLLLYGLQ